MKNKHVMSALVLFVLLAASACAQTNPQNTTNQDSQSNKPTQSSVHILDLSATQPPASPTVPPAPTPIPTQVQTVPTAALEAGDTPALEANATTAPVSMTAPACTNRAELVKHLTVSDNTMIRTGTLFAKAWRIKNTGTCTWTTAYSLVFSSGSNLALSQAPAPMSSEVKPGDTVDLSVLIMTPDKIGNYNSNWMLRDGSGNLFGIGDAADQPIALNISVQQTVDQKGPSCALCQKEVHQQ